MRHTALCSRCAHLGALRWGWRRWRERQLDLRVNRTPRRVRQLDLRVNRTPRRVRARAYCSRNSIHPILELPETAPFGKFSYRPKYLTKEYSSDVPFKFDLQHVQDDALGLIIPTLSQIAVAEIILSVRLTNGEEELLGATDELEGTVRDYSFEVRQQATADRSRSKPGLVAIFSALSLADIRPDALKGSISCCRFVTS